MNELSNQQIIQESRYKYPYHYIPMWDGNNFSQTQILVWGYEYLSYLYFILDKLGQIDFESLLDIGCGDGRFLFELSRKDIGKKLAGIDYYKRAIDFAKIMDTNVEWVCGDIKDKKIFDMKFDVITLIETLEHIKPDEIKTFLKGAHNYLKENGSFIVTVPSNNITVSKKHYQHFDLNSLKKTLSPFFRVVDLSYLNHKPSLSLRLIKILLSNRFFILNNRIMLRWIYNYYLDHLLITDKNNCQRIFVVCEKIA